MVTSLNRNNFMKKGFGRIFKASIFLAAALAAPAADRFVSPTGAHLEPFTDWAGAATNIQAAIDAAQPGDLIWVTNGLYVTGGKTTGGLTNRVTLDKPVTVQSVNGPDSTIIEGHWDPATNGPTAVRCAWLTNGAVLAGFTLRGGATRETGALLDYSTNYGGGAYGISTNALLQNCRLVDNAASLGGGGAFALTLRHCTVVGNVVAGTGAAPVPQGGGVLGCVLVNCVVSRNSAVRYTVSVGGGAASSVLVNCFLTGNYATDRGGGAYASTLVNCTVNANSAGMPSKSGMGAGVYNSTCVNSLIVSNYSNPALDNYYFTGSTLTFCCSKPLPSGLGNIAADPRLLSDGCHLAPDSPCRAAGTNTAASGTDLDGQPWQNPPSIGCDEWAPEPLVIVPPAARAAGKVGDLWFVRADAAGQPPFAWAWLKDGSPLDNGPKYSGATSTNLIVHAFHPADAGDYQIICSNAVGVVTSAVTRVFAHCVDAAALAPLAPYSSWGTAAPTLQLAVDAASANDVVLVTNGIYALGGKPMFSDLTNRVAVDKPLALMSVNGAPHTIIQGAWDPATTNGPLAVRCAWLADGASLNGFTLCGGATRSTGSSREALFCGGGVWGPPTALVMNSILATNAAKQYGGALFRVTARNCRLLGNLAIESGGGASDASLINCLVQGNWATSGGGGASYGGPYVHCTITGNATPHSFGAGISTGYSTPILNCIVYNNFSPAAPLMQNIFQGRPSNSCTVAYYTTQCITNDPQLLPDGHLAISSPCRAAANPAYTSGTDLEGEPWGTPPSIGCDEVWEDALTGPLTVQASVTPTQIAQTGVPLLQGSVQGRPSRVAWDFGDGSLLTNASYLSPAHAWADTGDYTVTFTAFNRDNPDGVSTELAVRVIPLLSPTLEAATLNTNIFTLSFESQIGVSYLVEQTTNLTPPMVWSTAWSGVGTGSPLTATDRAATNVMRFYRLRTQ